MTLVSKINKKHIEPLVFSLLSQVFIQVPSWISLVWLRPSQFPKAPRHLARPVCPARSRRRQHCAGLVVGRNSLSNIISLQRGDTPVDVLSPMFSSKTHQPKRSCECGKMSIQQPKSCAHMVKLVKLSETLSQLGTMCTHSYTHSPSTTRHFLLRSVCSDSIMQFLMTLRK